ncbi:pyridoxal-phosphate dependent enzyme [Leeia sp. TBRC 13508]|uniref:L-serine ammonia-lyase n=1 Tax=Leeia speluncae TaxID=2884804 RepID=A0ABS8D712_9NEIS|nr:pyridoxal-phosphate dependent enzyme [Leeia speluncae]MCB6183932.1 pyridoxal-phosphate dependent enzyme [Leeia speluncae]
MPLHIETPLLRSAPLSRANNREVWLKLENLQPPGSFKIRGIGHACTVWKNKGATKFVSSSGGNAGLAVAYAGKEMGVPVTVVVPETTTKRAIHFLKQEGAEVIVHGKSWYEANALAETLIEEGVAFIHPFDDPLLWEGHASMIDEVAKSGLTPDAVVLAVGGGGLLAGVAEGMQRNDWANVPIIAVETVGAGSLNAAISAGSPVEINITQTVATSLCARKVAHAAFEWTQQRPVISRLVSDQAALSACDQFLFDHRMLVEPACGAALAIAYESSPVLEHYQRVLVIVCGGVTADIEQIRQWKREAK